MLRGLRLAIAVTVLGALMPMWAVTPVRAQLSPNMEAQVQAAVRTVMQQPTQVALAQALMALIQANPQLVVEIAVVAVRMNPQLAGLIAGAAARAAPGRAVDIALAIVEVSPDSAGDVIAGIFDAVPGAGEQVTAAVTDAIATAAGGEVADEGGPPTPVTPPQGTAENPATDTASNT